MVIPTQFGQTIKKKFYDKEIVIYDVSDTKDSHYWQRKSHTTKVIGSFFGNIRFDKLDRFAQDYGIEEEISAVVTTDQHIVNGTITGYAGIQHEVIRSIKYDSHYLLIFKNYQSKSQYTLSV
jgi:hypothetical protein